MRAKRGRGRRKTKGKRGVWKREGATEAASRVAPTALVAVDLRENDKQEGEVRAAEDGIWAPLELLGVGDTGAHLVHPLEPCRSPWLATRRPAVYYDSLHRVDDSTGGSCGAALVADTQPAMEHQTTRPS